MYHFVKKFQTFLLAADAIVENEELRCNGNDNNCCTKETPCKEGDGDCDSDEDCLGSLYCETDSCTGDGFDVTDDCCAGGSDIYFHICEYQIHVHGSLNYFYWMENFLKHIHQHPALILFQCLQHVK